MLKPTRFWEARSPNREVFAHVEFIGPELTSPYQVHAWEKGGEGEKKHYQRRVLGTISKAALRSLCRGSESL